MQSNADIDAIYLRVSGDEQAKQETIQTQEHVIWQTFGPEGREVYKVYADDPYTGTAISRPALNQLMADARAGRFNRVLIYDPDRLARGELGMRSMLEYQLKQAGCTVRYARRERDASDAGRMMALMDDFISNVERGKIASRFADGAANKRARGALFRGVRPYGWRYVKPSAGQKDGTMEPVEAEVPIVREIFSLVLSGTSSKDVAAMLNTRGARNVRDNLWSPMNVRDVVHNPIHTGRPAALRYFVVEPVNPRKEHRKRVRSSYRELPREQWERIDIGHTIVSEDDFEQAAACLLKAQSRSKRNSKNIFPLAGILRCGYEHDHIPGKVCGRLLHGVTYRSGGRYYHCSRGAGSDPQMDHCCRGKAVAKDIELRLFCWVDQVMLNPEMLLEMFNMKLGLWLEGYKRLQAELAAAHAAREEIQAKLTALMLRSLEAEADRATIALAEAHLHEQRKAAESRIDLCQQQLKQTTMTARDAEEFEEFCRSQRSLFLALGDCEGDSALVIRQKLFRQWFDTVWVLPSGELRLEGELPSLMPSENDTIAEPIRRDSNRNAAVSRRPGALRFSLVIAA